MQVSLQQLNQAYVREDDGSKGGVAVFEENGLVVVESRTGVALMPEDIHSVQIRGEQAILQQHLYGRALDTLAERLSFDLVAQTCSKVKIGVATRR